MSSALWELFFPPACLACDRVLGESRFFCAGCQAELHRTPDVRCAICAEPGRFERNECPRCQLRPPPFSRAFAPFAHEGPVARAIHLFKYEDRPHLARGLAALVAATSGSFLEAASDAFVPIPLHVSRFRERKYDQAGLLAAELARLTGRKCLQLLERVRATERQVGLSDERREQNVAGAFAARPGGAGLRVVLVDDVFTTGATAREAARALAESGTADIQVLTVARANRLAS